MSKAFWSTLSCRALSAAVWAVVMKAFESSAASCGRLTAAMRIGDVQQTSKSDEALERGTTTRLERTARRPCE